MLRASTKNFLTGRHMLILGLEPENIKRMNDGQPILVNGDSVGIEMDVLIFTGEDTDAMTAQLKEVGFAFGQETPQ